MPPMSLTRSFWGNSLLFLLVLSANAQKKCYWPNGEETDDTYTACPTDPNKHSACCAATNNSCLSNGLCEELNHFNWRWRNACTDPTWKDASCPKYCLGKDTNSSAHLAFQCNDAGDTYCCSTGDSETFARQENKTCCTDRNLVFSAAAQSLPTALPTGTLSTGSVLPTNTQTSGGTALTSTNPDGSLATATSTNNSPPPSSSESRTIPIALGTTIPIAVLSLSALFFVLYRRRRRQDSPYLQAPPAYPEQSAWVGGMSEPTSKYAHSTHIQQPMSPQELGTAPEVQELPGNTPGHVQR